MFHKLKNAALSFMLCLSLATSVGLAATSASYADVDKSRSAACQGIGLTGGSCTDDSGQKGVTKLVSTVVNIVSVLVGVAAIIMIIVSGFRYVVSGGDGNSVAGAKNGLIYAVVGLVVVTLAQFIVHFVLSRF